MAFAGALIVPRMITWLVENASGILLVKEILFVQQTLWKIH